MKRRLSSIITPFYKAFPFLLVLYGLFWLIYDFQESVASLGGFILYFLVCAVCWFFTFRWKSVSLKGDVLSVSNYLKRREIPLANLERVDASSWWWGSNPRTITIRLKSPSEFGDRIVFVPRLAGLEAGEIADELRNLIAANRR